MWTVAVLKITGAERVELERRVRAQRTAQRMVRRCRIVLLAAEGVANDYVRNGVTDLRRARCRDRPDDHHDHTPSPRRRVQGVLEHDRQDRSPRTRRPRRVGQLLDAEDPRDLPVAAAAPRASSCTSLRPAAHGSTSWNAGSRNSPAGSSNDPRTAASPRSRPTCGTGPRRGTRTRGPLSGTRPRTRSSTPSPHIANESPAQVTRSVGLNRPASQFRLGWS
jgi:hypothetical protein